MNFSRIKQRLKFLTTASWFTAGKNLAAHDGLELAGYVAYTAIVAIFPFLIFLTALAGFFGSENTADKAVNMLFSYMPEDVAQTLTPVVRDVLTNRQGGLLTFGIVFTLYSASSGIEAVRTSLNRAYGGTDARPFWERRLQSLGFVIVSAMAALIVTTLIVAWPFVKDWLSQTLAMQLDQQIILTIGHFVVGIVVVAAAFMVVHRYLPSQTLPWGALWPGVMASGALLLFGAGLFSLYLSHSTSYSVTYGSLGGVIITLLFFYYSAVIFTYGAEINAVRWAAKHPGNTNQA